MKICLIGGTGRSGTKPIREMLLKHPSVSALPYETRFLSDPEGIVDYYTSFKKSYSPFWVDRKIRRLISLLDDIDRGNLFYYAWTLVNRVVWWVFRREFFSEPRYCRLRISRDMKKFRIHKKQLKDDLIEFSYPGRWVGTPGGLFMPKVHFHSDYSQEKLAGILRKFIINVTSDYLSDNSATHYVEDTPFSSLFSQEILEILPDAKILVIIRDPRDVVSSFVTRRYSPKTFEQAALWYKSVVKRWLKVEAALPAGSVRIMKLEEIVSSPQEHTREICVFFELEYIEKLNDFNWGKSHSGRWKTEMNKMEQNAVIEILRQEAEALGYEL